MYNRGKQYVDLERLDTRKEAFIWSGSRNQNCHRIVAETHKVNNLVAFFSYINRLNSHISSLYQTTKLLHNSIHSMSLKPIYNLCKQFMQAKYQQMTYMLWYNLNYTNNLYFYKLSSIESKFFRTQIKIIFKKYSPMFT